MGTAEVRAGWLVVTLSVAKGAMTVLLLWRFLNSMPVSSGVGRGGVCVGRAVNDSTMDKRVGMNLFSWSWGVWMDGKGSGRFGSWEGDRGLWLQKKQSVSISVNEPSSIGIHQSLNLGDGTELLLADVEESEDGIGSI